MATTRCKHLSLVLVEERDEKSLKSEWFKICNLSYSCENLWTTYVQNSWVSSI